MKWNEEHLKELKNNYFYYLEHHEEAETYFGRNIQLIKIKASELNITSMKINTKCSRFLGEHVAERILSHVFKDVKRMPNGNRGFDFICNKGFKIDVKASCLNKNNIYTFNIKHNKIADYFLLIAFDNRENLNPEHVWLIKSNEVTKNYRKLNDFENLYINTFDDISDFSRYELTDKLKETIECCSTLKSNNKAKEEVT